MVNFKFGFKLAGDTYLAVNHGTVYLKTVKGEELCYLLFLNAHIVGRKLTQEKRGGVVCFVPRNGERTVRFCISFDWKIMSNSHLISVV